MARARNIKPSFFQNEMLAELDPLTRLAFIGMWTIADFKGCIEFRPKRLKIQLLPYDDCDIEQIGINLDKSGFVSIYSVQGQRYLKIINFEKHQNPHKNEREAGSEIPDFDSSDNKIKELQTIENNPEQNGTAPADSLLLPTDSLNLIPDSGIPQVPPPKNGDDPKPETDLQAASRETWQAYATAYFSRYGTEPVQNKTVRSQIKAFVQRIGFSESPGVAAHYLASNNAFYTQRGHAVGSLLADAEKLRTEWATGQSMTATRAKQIDKSQANYSAVDEAMKIIKGAQA